jgi:hypothetical protein
MKATAIALSAPAALSSAGRTVGMIEHEHSAELLELAGSVRDAEPHETPAVAAMQGVRR